MDIFGKIVEVASNTLGGWFETFAKITLKSGAVVKPKANLLQQRTSEIIDWCEEVRRPVRLLLLKPRQKGCSTISVGALKRKSKLKKIRSAIIGAGYDQTSSMFSILKTYCETDTWKKGGKGKVLRDIARWDNGSECRRLTANNPEAGRSWTYQFILATEVARWSEDGVSNAAKVLSGLMKCVVNEPDTTIILETTAAGAHGDFYERYQKAITFEEAKAGKPGFIKVFMPWFVFEDSKRDPHLEEIHSEHDLNEFEVDYMDEWGLNLAQMAWMRWAIREECNGDIDQFYQDYPSDEVSAFLTSGRCIFNAEALQWQSQRAKLAQKQHVYFEVKDDKVAMIPTSEKESTFTVWQKPVSGGRYLVAVDQMTGASQTGGADPDSHGVKVWRAGYMDRNRKWVPHEIVASLNLYQDGVLRGNYFDIDVLTDFVLRVSKYYGNCLIVPEINMDRGMIELLKQENANIYQREVFNKRKNITMEAYGWMTDSRNRRSMIEKMVREIRESSKQDNNSGVVLNCEDVIKEAKSFIRRENGREEAAQGSHDDQLFAAMIGLAVIEKATLYTTRNKEEFIPPELRGQINRRGRGGGGGAFRV